MKNVNGEGVIKEGEFNCCFGIPLWDQTLVDFSFKER